VGVCAKTLKLKIEKNKIISLMFFINGCLFFANLRVLQSL
jgi:hypothetical protein